jgi:4-hydroxybenzoyl-CoA thioesterase
VPYIHRTKIRFAHIDAAGIVFYPRYFELLNAAVEDWFAEDLKRDFKTLHLEDRIGTPTVKIDAEFVSPGMLGDELEISITPQKVGLSSCTFAFTMRSGDALRMQGSAVLVCMDLDRKKSRAWPDAIRMAMESDRDDGVA